MKVVIDTNVLLMSIPKISKFRLIFDALLNGKYVLVISESILQEYIEIIGAKTTSEIAQNLGELLLKLENIEKAEIYYYWNLIKNDPDDNKFADCAISAGARFIVTNDHHFNILKEVNFPPVEVISADDFLNEIKLL